MQASLLRHTDTLLGIIIIILLFHYPHRLQKSGYYGGYYIPPGSDGILHRPGHQKHTRAGAYITVLTTDLPRRPR